MTDKVSGYGRVGLDIGPSRNRAVSRSEPKVDTGATQRSRQNRDAVEITDTAARLKQIEGRLKDVPDVDQARVEALRKRVESGDYQPDPARIAQKLMRMEQDLA